MMATAQRSVNSATLVCVGVSGRARRGRSARLSRGAASPKKQAGLDRPSRPVNETVAPSGDEDGQELSQRVAA